MHCVRYLLFSIGSRVRLNFKSHTVDLMSLSHDEKDLIKRVRGSVWAVVAKTTTVFFTAESQSESTSGSVESFGQSASHLARKSEPLSQHPSVRKASVLICTICPWREEEERWTSLCSLSPFPPLPLPPLPPLTFTQFTSRADHFIQTTEWQENLALTTVQIWISLVLSFVSTKDAGKAGLHHTSQRASATVKSWTRYCSTNKGQEKEQPSRQVHLLPELVHAYDNLAQYSTSLWQFNYLFLRNLVV